MLQTLLKPLSFLTGSTHSGRSGPEPGWPAVNFEPLLSIHSGNFMNGRNFKIANMADRGRKKRRKRKDSTSHVKPPLDFIESPLDGRKYYCTPVQAARRPFLAASLPVDDAEAMKWVSFHNISKLLCIKF